MVSCHTQRLPNSCCICNELDYDLTPSHQQWIQEMNFSVRSTSRRLQRRPIFVTYHFNFLRICKKNGKIDFLTADLICANLIAVSIDFIEKNGKIHKKFVEQISTLKINEFSNSLTIGRSSMIVYRPEISVSSDQYLLSQSVIL